LWVERSAGCAGLRSRGMHLLRKTVCERSFRRRSFVEIPRWRAGWRWPSIRLRRTPLEAKSRLRSNWICAGQRFNCACGRLCARSLAGKREATASWRVRWAWNDRRVPSPVPARSIAYRCLFPATAWSAQAGHSPAIAGEWSASANCLRRSRVETRTLGRQIGGPTGAAERISRCSRRKRRRFGH